MPLGSVTAGGNVLSVYRLVLVLISIIMLVAFYMFFNYTKFGLYSRATMQNAEVAKALGISTSALSMYENGIGAGIAGLAGALYAPVMAVSPILGDSFIIQAFTTVVVGGGNPLIGTFLSGTVLGVISGIVSLEQGQFIGKIAMLVAASSVSVFFQADSQDLLRRSARGFDYELKDEFKVSRPCIQI